MARYSPARAPIAANAQTETPIVQDILLALGSRSDVRLFRANVGVASFSPDAPPVHFGTPGQPDLMGWIQPEGWWLGVEVKRPASARRRGGSLSIKQKNYRAAALRGGCCHIVATSALDAALQLNAWVEARRTAVQPRSQP